MKKAIIIGSERGVSRLSSEDSYPQALEVFSDSEITVLDWIVTELKKCNIDNIIFVGGHHIEKIIERYPSFKFYFEPEWKNFELFKSIKVIEDELDDELLILNTSTLFRESVISSLITSESELSISSIRNEKQEISAYIMRFKQEALNVLKEKIHTEGISSFDDIVNLLKKNKVRVEAVDGGDDICSLHSNKSLAKFILGTKAQTLLRLKPMLKKSIVLDQVTFSIKNWLDDQEKILEKINIKFNNKALVARSSSIYEDSWGESHAGRFDSILNIDSNNTDELSKAIDIVFQSYHDQNFYSKKNEVLVQPHVSNVKISGVVFTKEISTNAPYYIVNYDDTSTQTDTVTSGCFDGIKKMYVYNNSKLKLPYKWLSLLISAVKELEGVLLYSDLDIEFAIDSDNKVYILQARPIVNKNQEYAGLLKEDFHNELKMSKDFIEKITNEDDGEYKGYGLLGIMSDWNPAEMIGISPKPLALSLYSELITNKNWAIARNKIGYVDLMDKNLMVSICGRPYINIKRSFSSFIVQELSKNIANELIEKELIYLNKNQDQHDKVEFNVAINCHTLDSNAMKDHLINNLKISEKYSNEIISVYLKWTDDLIKKSSQLSIELDQQYQKLNERRRATSYTDNLTSISSKISSLMIQCQDDGIIPFSIHARIGFISLIIMKSLKNNGIFSKKQYDGILANIPTVSSEFNRDLRRYISGKMNTQDFINLYGHLRASSYDIQSLNYADLVDQGFFDKGNDEYFEKESIKLGKANEIWNDKVNEINTFLKDQGFTVNANTLFDFVVLGIQGRERGKFEFTKNLDMIIMCIKKICNILNISIEDASYLPIERYLEFSYSSQTDDFVNHLKREINRAKKKYAITSLINIGPLIQSGDDLDFINHIKSEPNYITNNKTSGQLILLDSKVKRSDVAGKIVLVEAADPGYDWIFSQEIKGLITLYGGIASHMAIRAAEYGVPAVIGCGSDIFIALQTSKFISIDCRKRSIDFLS